MVKDLLAGLARGDSAVLARAITLVESSRETDWDLAKQLLSQLPSSTQKTRRLGFSGPPGVGKSTFIEKLGLEFINNQHRVAVLAVDPSSELTGGSILGDKTRMEELSRHPQAFVRPSPSRGHLGGVTSQLPGVILLCEAAGFDVIMIESVGVGQSEVELSRMVDFFSLLALPGAGDELQGIKKGILEYVDLVLVNKADRDKALVNNTKQQYLAALKIVRSSDVEVLSCSGLTGQGISDVSKVFESLYQNFDNKKREQFSLLWFQSLIYSEFKKRLTKSPHQQKQLQALKDQIGQNKTNVFEAIDQFFSDLNL